MHSVRYITSFLIVIQLVSCNPSEKDSSGVMSGKYWKDQALNDIIPSWTRYSQNERSGTFYTNLDSVWNPFGSTEIYPSMIARNLFGFSAAYLLSGNDEYISIADKTAKWLIEKAWDREYGLWYDALDEAGNPTMTSKTTFVQVYVITGLSLYYFVTRDSTVLHYIEKSNELLEQKVWDKEGGGGYFNMVNRDWSPGDPGKSFSSEITPVSGYLMYLYLATLEPEYQNQINRVLDMVTERMIDSETGWVLEDFDRYWNYMQGKNDASEINTGHNLETSWMLMKNYLLTSDENHKKTALNIAAKIHEAGILNKNDVWLGSATRTSPARLANDTYWWIQAYGNMVSLYLYRTTGDKKYIEDFRKGADLWDRCFMDRKHGDTFFRIDSAGNMLDATKAGRFKASYHNMEHCLVNYQCLNLWVNNEPVEFHFRINSSEEGAHLNPVLLEGGDIKIKKAVFEERPDRVLKTEDRSVVLPTGKNYKVCVILEGR